VRCVIGLPAGDPRAVWVALERRFRATTLAALIKGELWHTKQAKSEQAGDYASRIQRLVHRIKASGGEVSSADINAIFILGLAPAIAQPINTMLTLTDIPLKQDRFEGNAILARGRVDLF
jgi:hypothetical protein